MKTLSSLKIELLKSLMLLIIMSTLTFLAFAVAAQTKKDVAVLNIDTKGMLLDPVQMGNIVRIELEKTNTYVVMDKYDMTDIIEQNNLQVEDCFGKSCLVELAKVLNVNQVLTGSVERYGEKLILSFRLIDVKENRIVNSRVDEYLNIQPEIQSMVEISIKKMLGIAIDMDLEALLANEFNYESLTRNPGATRVVLNGPRMGIAYITGDKGQRLQDNRKNGGYDIYPYMAQFGYQHEVQYLNEGNFQAVFEMIVTVSGIDQGLFIPSLTFMNGFRNNKYGLEFAFGPTFGIVNKAFGTYQNGEWILEKHFEGDKESEDFVQRIDRRGDPVLSTGFIWAVGKTFKSGHLNIPINAYVAPGREGWYVGLSLGFNSRGLSK
ncbi:hypothetical protein JYU23_00090 [bacterium AH-315-C07]|nr:hypothetical protein [bacterium AH-315-C07]